MSSFCLLLFFLYLMTDHLTTHLDTNYMINQLDDLGFVILDHVYHLDYLKNLYIECVHGLDQFRKAAIQDGIVRDIRSDHILWLTDAQVQAQQHIAMLAELSQLLNQAFFFGLNDIEAHFACYNAGEAYALHRDNPQQKNHRVISSVFYLHQTWQPHDGGELRLQDRSNQWHIIQPLPNRLVIFDSHLLHEVLQSHQQRLSITAWLRNDKSVWS